MVRSTQRHVRPVLNESEAIRTLGTCGGRYQIATLRFVGSGSPTARLYLYSETNLSRSCWRHSQRFGTKDSLGDYLVDDRWVPHSLVISDEPSRLYNGDLAAPF